MANFKDPNRAALVNPTGADLPPPEDHKSLIAQCNEFLAAQTPANNVVFKEEFDKYVVLFNRKMQESVSPEELKKLGDEYYRRFSMQHPIKVVAKVEDPQGVFHPISGRRYKLLVTIPAQQRKVSTLNDMGARVPELITAFMNACTTKKGAFDRREEMYAKAIADAITRCDSKNDDIKEKKDEFTSVASELVRPTGEQPSKTDQPKEDEKELDDDFFEWQ